MGAYPLVLTVTMVCSTGSVFLFFPARSRARILSSLSTEICTLSLCAKSSAVLITNFLIFIYIPTYITVVLREMVHKLRAVSLSFIQVPTEDESMRDSLLIESESEK